jgi:hypothetical protein
MSKSGFEILLKFGEISAHFCSEKLAIAHFFLATKKSTIKNGQKSGQKPGLGQNLKGKKWAEKLQKMVKIVTKYRKKLRYTVKKIALFWVCGQKPTLFPKKILKIDFLRNTVKTFKK